MHRFESLNPQESECSVLTVNSYLQPRIWCANETDSFVLTQERPTLKPRDEKYVELRRFNCRALFIYLFPPRSGELRTQKLKSHLVRTQSLNDLPLKPGVGQYIAIHATLTARDFFLAYFYPSGPFTRTFPDLSRFLLCWLWLTHGSSVGPQNKIGHPAGCRFPC